jgi:preprotein translocase subunit SecB
MENKIFFEGYRVDYINFRANSLFKNESFDIGINPTYAIRVFLTDHEDVFKLSIECSLFKNIPSDKRPFDLNVIVEGMFKVDVSDKEKRESLLQYNGVSVLMPYLRATVAQVTGTSGFPQINLPLIYLDDLYKKAKNIVKDGKNTEEANK